MPKEGTFYQFKKLIKILPYRRYLLIGIMLILVLAFSEIFTSYFMKGMIDSAKERNLDKFYQMLFLIIGAQIVSVILTFYRTRILGNYSEKGLKLLRNKLAIKYNNLDVGSLSENHSGDYISRATNDVNKVKNFITNSLPFLITIPVSGIGALIYLLILSWKLTLISLAIIPLLILVVGVLSKPLGPISKRLQEKLGLINSLVQDYIKGIEVSKAYKLEKVLGKQYDDAVEESVVCGKQLAKRRATLQSFAELISLIPFFVTFILGGYFVIQGEMSIGGLLAFINLLNLVTHPFVRMPQLIAQTKIDLAGSSRIFEVLDHKEERVNGENYNINGARYLVEFSDVEFSYPNTQGLVLKDLNLKIKKGEKVALVGPSGGGKSTIIKMLLGYYNEYEGSIHISGHELREWNLTGIRDKIALVSQDVFLFPESIEENIAYGKNEIISNNDIKQAAVLANADMFITNLDMGYQTNIGELGNKLSGGQRQRISIARAIIKDAPILLLDEATSALDNESEHLVQEALEHLMEDKTSIVVAHRLSTIKNVDRILVVDHGQIVEEGTHDELMGNSTIYKDLCSKQLKLDHDEEGKVA